MPAGSEIQMQTVGSQAPVPCRGKDRTCEQDATGSPALPALPPPLWRTNVTKADFLSFSSMYRLEEESERESPIERRGPRIDPETVHSP